MSLGTQKALDATAAAPKTDHAQLQPAAWNVSNQEMLAHIKQDRAAVVQAPHAEVRPAIAQVVQHPQPAQTQQLHRPDVHNAVAPVQLGQMHPSEAQRTLTPGQPFHGGPF